MKNIQDKSIPYEMLRIYVKFVFPKFFREVEVRNVENIPLNQPVIFAPNHQCGLIDPLSVLLNQHDPVVFMARADIFKSKALREFLNFLKITPVYRIRDGYENLTKNESQFKMVEKVLLEKKQLCLMPEGTQGDKRRLLPLVKGLFRIAFSADEKLQRDNYVRIVPVGINYSNYLHAGSDLVVSFGEPVMTEEYLPLHKENPANALNVLKKDLSEKISGLIVDIRSKEHYDIIYHLSCYCTPAILKQMNIHCDAKNVAGKKFDVRKLLGKKLDEIDRTNPEKISQWGNLCKRIDKLPGSPVEIAEWMNSKIDIFTGIFYSLISILLSPWLLLNLPVWLICRKINSTNEDKQMNTTISFVAGLLLDPLMYLAISIIIGYFFNIGVGLTIALFLTNCIMCLLAERWRQHIRIPFRRFIHLFGNKRQNVIRCRKDYRLLMQSMDNLIKTFC